METLQEMTAKTIRLFSTKDDEYIQLFKEVAKQKQIKVSVYFYEKFSFINDKLNYRGKKEFPLFSKQDTVLFRRCSYDKPKQHFWVRLLAILARDAGASVINSKHMVSFPMHSGKLFQAAYFSANNIEHVATYQFDRKLKDDIFPIIVKRQYGAFGIDSHLIQNQEDFLTFKESVKGKAKYVIQPFTELTRDVRVLVIGKKIVGSVMRKVTKHADGHVGVKVVSITKLTKKEREIATKVIAVMDLEFAGIDLFTNTTNRVWLGEVNFFPNFKGFTKVTGNNIFEHIIEYLHNY